MGRFKNFDTFQIQPLDSGNAAAFAAQWFQVLAEELTEEKAKEKGEDLVSQMSGKSALKRVFNTPMLLGMAVEFYLENQGQIAEDRGQLYMQYVADLWQKSKNRQEVLPLPEDNLDKAILVLEVIAWWLTEQPEITREQLVKKLIAAPLNLNTPAAEGWISFLREGMGIIFQYQIEQSADQDQTQTTPHLGFRHKTYQEYFVSCRLLALWRENVLKTWKILAPRIYHPDWQEPLILLAVALQPEIKNGMQVYPADSLGKKILKHPHPFKKHLQPNIFKVANLWVEGTDFSMPFHKIVSQKLKGLIRRKIIFSLMWLKGIIQLVILEVRKKKMEYAHYHNSRNRKISDLRNITRQFQIKAVSPLAERLPEMMIEEAWKAAKELGNDLAKFYIMLTLANLSQNEKREALLEESLTIVRKQRNKWIRDDMLITLALKFPPHMIKEALYTANEISKVSEREHIYIELINKMPGEIISEYPKIVKSIDSEWILSRILVALIPILPKNKMGDILSTARNINNIEARVPVLMDLIGKMMDTTKGEMIREIFTLIPDIQDKNRRISYLKKLSAKGAPDFLDEILDIAYDVEDYLERSQILISVAEKLQNNKIIEKLLWDTISMIDKTKDEWMGKGIYDFSAHLFSEKMKDKALSFAWEVVDEEGRIYLLISIAETFPQEKREKLALEILRLARKYKYLDDRAFFLSEIAMILPENLREEVFKESLEAAANSGEQYVLVRTLNSLPKNLPADLVQEAFKLAETIRPNWRRLSALASLIKILPENEKGRKINQVLRRVDMARGDSNVGHEDIMELIMEALPEDANEKTYIWLIKQHIKYYWHNSIPGLISSLAKAGLRGQPPVGPYFAPPWHVRYRTNLEALVIFFAVTTVSILVFFITVVSKRFEFIKDPWFWGGLTILANVIVFYLRGFLKRKAA